METGKSYTKVSDVLLLAALIKLKKHGYDDYHHRGQTVDILNGDGSYVRLHVGNKKGVPLEDHAKPDGTFRYPAIELFVIAHEFLPEYINLKE